MCSNYVSLLSLLGFPIHNSYYYYHFTCDSCVLCCIIHHYDCYDGFHLCGPEMSGQHKVVMLPQLILRDTVKGFACLITMLQQEFHQSQMPYWTYANYAMGLSHVSFFFQSSASDPFIYHVLVSVVVFAFCFQVPMRLP